jgi:hypothetical protein
MSHSRRVLIAVISAILALGVLVAPAAADMDGTPAHVWKQHLLPLAKKVFYTKAQSDAKYATKTEVDSTYLSKSAADSNYVGKGDFHLGTVSCAGAQFRQHSGTDAIVHDHGWIYHEGQGSNLFSCGLAIPQGATIGSYGVSVWDSHSGGEVSCSLNRFDFLGDTVTQIGVGVVTGVEASANAWVELGEQNFSTVVDNHAASYSVMCTIPSSGSSLALAGAWVNYSYPAEIS